MKELRERCEDLAEKMGIWNTGMDGFALDEYAGHIESFAREIRNEALEDVADYFDNYISLLAHEEHWVAEEIRKFKDATTLAAADKGEE